MLVSKRRILLFCFTSIILIFIIFTYKKNVSVTEDNIIRNFKQNKEAFENIAKYAQRTRGDLYIFNGDKLEVSINYSDGTCKIININHLPIKSDVFKIVKKLKYVEIHEDTGENLKGIIIFSRTTGKEERGIYYTKIENMKYGWKNIKIMDGWYYFYNALV